MFLRSKWEKARALVSHKIHWEGQKGARKKSSYQAESSRQKATKKNQLYKCVGDDNR